MRQGILLGVPAALASGAMLAALFPSIGASFLAWVALVPLILAARAVSPRAAAGLGYAAGVLFFLILVEWMRIFDTTGWIVASLVLALYVALFALLVRLLAPTPGGWRAVLVPAAAWTALEWARGLGPAGFTWGGLAYSQHGSLPLIQTAAVAGPLGITFLIAAANAALAAGIASAWPAKPPESAESSRDGNAGSAESMRRRGIRRALVRLGVVAAAVAACWAWGWVRLARAPDASPGVRVAVLQGNVGGEGDDLPWSLRKIEESTGIYLRLTDEAARSGAQVVVWPESSVPGGLELGTELRHIRRQIVDASAQLGVSILVGSSHEEGGGRLLNSTFLYTPEAGLAGRYDKVHLVPFGEYTPWRRRLDFLYRYFPIIDFEFFPGKGFFALETHAAPVGVAICFESAFPGIARALRRAGARVLVVTTNDAWFGERSATWQHYHMAAFRAVESGSALARASTTGVSALIDPYGRAAAETGLSERRMLVGDVPLAQGPTLYMRLGDVVAWLSALALLALLAVEWRRAAGVDVKTWRQTRLRDRGTERSRGLPGHETHDTQKIGKGRLRGVRTRGLGDRRGPGDDQAGR